MTNIGGAVTGEGGTDTYKKYYGTLTLTFDDLLYWIDNTGDTKTMMPVYNRPTDGSTGYALLAHLGGAASKLTSTGTGTSPTSTFSFTYSGVNVGDQITLFADGYVCNSSGYSTKNRIILEFTETRTGIGDQIFYTHGWKIVSQ